MDKGISILCNTCDYEKGINIPNLMDHWTFENVLDFINHRQRHEIENGIFQRPIAASNIPGEENPYFKYCLNYCPDCLDLLGRFYVRIKYLEEGEEKIYETKFTCSKCNVRLKPIEEIINDIEGYPCPNCKENHLDIGFIQNYIDD